MWKGYYVQEGQRFPMNFIEFEFHINDGRMRARGHDAAGNFNMSGMMCDKEFNAEKIYPGWIIYYKGTHNEDTNEITGYWGFSKGSSVEPFAFQNIDLRDQN